MDIDKKDIELYLSEVKEAVENGRYRLDRNARRQDNINLFLDYVINEAKVREIILSLTEMDFSGMLRNEHKGFEHERLYVFGKDVILLERNGTEEKTVSLYPAHWPKKALQSESTLPKPSNSKSDTLELSDSELSASEKTG